MILAGLLSVVGVLVGIVARGEIDDRRVRNANAEKVILTAFRIQSVYQGLVHHVGVNTSKLTPILAQNMEGKGFDKPRMEKLIGSALEAFPLPEPQVQYPEKDSYGYDLVAISNMMMDYVRVANKIAMELKAGDRSANQVNRFLIAANAATDVNIIIQAAEAGFGQYMDSLALVHGNKLSAKRKAQEVKEFGSNLREVYKAAVEVAKQSDGYWKSNDEFLRSLAGRPRHVLRLPAVVVREDRGAILAALFLGVVSAAVATSTLEAGLLAVVGRVPLP